MRYGLLALSIAMLASGGVAAQSAFAISASATAEVPVSAAMPAHRGIGQSFTAERAQGLRLAAR